MKGVILAAGKGSRLYPVTHHIPKPLLPIANRMTLEYAFEQLVGMGVHEICVVVGENEQVMKDRLGNGSEFGVDLTFVRQTDPHGLAHAVGFTREFVNRDKFVLYLGDALYDRPLKPYAEQFLTSGCENLNLVKEVEDPRRFGVANVVDGRIVKLVEKPANPESPYAMAGLYFFGPALWDVLTDLKPSARGEYEITDAIQLLIDGGADVRPGIFEGVWFDTGTLESFLETSRFLTEEGVLMGQGAEILAPVGRHVVVGSGAMVEATLIEDSVILPGACVRVEGTIQGCLIGGTVTADNDLEHQILWG